MHFWRFVISHGQFLSWRKKFTARSFATVQILWLIKLCLKQIMTLKFVIKNGHLFCSKHIFFCTKHFTCMCAYITNKTSPFTLIISERWKKKTKTLRKQRKRDKQRKGGEEKWGVGDKRKGKNNKFMIYQRMDIRQRQMQLLLRLGRQKSGSGEGQGGIAFEVAFFGSGQHLWQPVGREPIRREREKPWVEDLPFLSNTENENE